MTDFRQPRLRRSATLLILFLETLGCKTLGLKFHTKLLARLERGLVLYYRHPAVFKDQKLSFKDLKKRIE